jgi:hypothetical protein
MVLTLVVGIVGAIVLAALAGARRTDSALRRFNEVSLPADLQLQVREPTAAKLEEFRRTPEVAAMAVLPEYLIIPRGLSIVNVPANVDGSFGTVLDRARLISGREANPEAVDEITIGEGLAKLLDLEVGGHLDARSATPEQLETVFADEDPGEPAGPDLRLRVVGIVRRPLDLGELGASGGLFALTPAFHRAYADRIGVYVTNLRIRTHHGAEDLDAVRADARRVFGGSELFSVTSLTPETEGARSAIDVLVRALLIFAGVAALGGLVAVGIVVGREIALMDEEQTTLRALGFTRVQRAAVHGPQAALVAAGGAGLAALGAIGLSPWFPINVARRAEPNPGLHIDRLILGAGFMATAGAVLLIAFTAAWRTTRRSLLDGEPRPDLRPRTIAEAAARAGAPPTLSSGLRMALTRGSGLSAVPVRSALLGAVLGVAGVTAVLVFAANVTRVVETPQRSGVAWDFMIQDGSTAPCGPDDTGVSRVPGVEAIAELCYGTPLQVDGHPIAAMTFTQFRGSFDPEIAAGRAPRGGHEIAVGAETMRSVGKGIGDRVEVASLNGTSRSYRIVGQAVLPPIGFGQSLAEGAILTPAGHAPLFDVDNFYRFFVGRFGSDADRAAVTRRIAANPRLEDITVPAVAADVDHLRQVGWVPGTLAGLLGALGLLAVGHALVTSTRRRRHELAVLMTLGFTGRQVRAAVSWQATTFAVVGLLVGVPAGVVVGRRVWQAVASGLGISTVTSVPALALAALIPAAVASCALLALLPARAAARTRPAAALRSE